MIDVVIVPKWLEQDVAKANSHQVLHRFFAQIVVDAIYLILAKVIGKRRVQVLRCIQITPKGFFNDDPAWLV